MRGHDWAANAAARTKTGSGCQVGAWANYQRAQESLAVTHPDVAAQWHPTANGAAVPEEVTYGSGRRVWWRCDLGHEWRSLVKDRSRRGGCPVCGRIQTPRHMA